MCTDKALDELGDFSDLVEESRKTGLDWKIVFVACLAGRAGVMPSTEDAQTPLKNMVDSIPNGAVSRYLAYDSDGNQVRFSREMRPGGCLFSKASNSSAGSGLENRNPCA